MKCHEKIETNIRSNFNADEAMVLEDMTPEQIIEQLFIGVVEKIEAVHDFDSEIQHKK